MDLLQNVLIGDYKTYDDWNLILKHKEISEAEPDVQLQSVPFRNSSIDYTEVVTGKVTYKDRTISMTFLNKDIVFENIEQYVSNIRNSISGKRLRIIFEDDIGFYWSGRITSVEKSINGKGINPSIDIIISATVDAYKYCLSTSEEDWLWDPFDFENGIINETLNIDVNPSGTKRIQISTLSDDRVTAPVIISDSSELTLDVSKRLWVTETEEEWVVILYNHRVRKGSESLFDVELEPNTTYEFTFINNAENSAKVGINYLGGML